MKRTNTVIVGAGQNGLAMSRELIARSIDHVVLERGRPGNSWHTSHWDSLRLLTPNWMNGLAGLDYDGPDHDGFMSAAEFAARFDRAVGANGTPVQSETSVLAVSAFGSGYRVQTDQGAIDCDNVVMASGAFSKPKLPASAADLPDDVQSFDGHSYKRPSDLPDGTVMVVGGSASGLQIASEIQASGRQVILSTGAHLRLPRNYRGCDIMTWMEILGLMSVSHTEVDDLARVRRVPSPQLIGSDTGADLNLNRLQAEGVEVVGRLAAIRDGRALFSGGLHNEAKAADLKMQRLLTQIDAWVAASGMADLIDAAEPQAPIVLPEAHRLQMDLSGIGAVVWATGYAADHSCLKLPVFDRKGQLRHDGGVVGNGLYAMGLPFMRNRRSTYIDGAVDDARALADHLSASINNRLAA